MFSEWKWIVLEGLILTLIALHVSMIGLRRSRRIRKALEDRLVDVYTLSVQIMNDMLKLQEQALGCLHKGAERLDPAHGSALSNRLRQIEEGLNRGRGRYGDAALSGKVSSIHWEDLVNAKSECDAIWGALVEALGEAIDKPLPAPPGANDLSEQRLAQLAAAQTRIQELEAEVDSLTEQTSNLKHVEGGATTEEAHETLERIEGQWDERLASAKQMDETLRRGISGMAEELQTLELVNQRLVILAAKLRERQQAMARRIAELEAQAGMTPRLKEELHSLSIENEELHKETHRLLEANQAMQLQVANLRQTIEQLQSQPSRSETLASHISQDRQLLQLLREQNQRLVLELEETQERAALAGEAEDLHQRYEALMDENKQLAAQHVRVQEVLRRKFVEIEDLCREIRRLRAAAPTSIEAL